jgi:hypothetical protein
VVKCRRFGCKLYLHTYGSTISHINRAGPSATSVNFYQFSSQLLYSFRRNNSISLICNSFVCFYGCTPIFIVSAAYAVYSVPPLSFDVDGLRFWFRFLAASEFSQPQEHLDSYGPHPASSAMGIKAFSRVQDGRGFKVTTHLILLQGLRIHGTVNPLVYTPLLRIT